jgi:hypothetical protein
LSGVPDQKKNEVKGRTRNKKEKNKKKRLKKQQKTMKAGWITIS